MVLNAESCDPEVVLRNRLTLLLEVEAQPGVNLGRGSRDVQDLTPGDETFDLGEVLRRLARVDGTIAQLADYWHRQQMFGDVARKEVVSLVGQHVDRDAGIKGDAITTPWNRRARTHAR
jgi:hypothetical protein